MRFDVVVVGSGAAGLTAALVAGRSGCSVCVLEKTALLGGTSSVSGGSIWAPANRWAFADGGDTREDAMRYLKALALNRSSDEMLGVFLDNVNPMLAYLSNATGLEFTANERHSDYQPALSGARLGGRTVQNGLYDSRRLGELAASIRQPGSHSVPLTKLERDQWGEDTPERWDWDLISQRRREGIVGQGMALIGELVEACVANRVTLLRGSPAVGLVRSTDRIVGCAVGPSGDVVEARLGVVLASGGFEWNEDLVRRFLSMPMLGPASPPANTGDGLIMAMEVGAALAHLDDAWWAPVLDAGETYEGSPHFRTTSGLRSMPGGIMVNRFGQRFCNEAMNYNDLAKAMGSFDPAEYRFSNMPTWLVFDSTFRERYSVGPVGPKDPTPSWMICANSTRELCELAGIDPNGLKLELGEFNRDAVLGRDNRFGRGQSAYDLYRGDASAPHRTLAPISCPRFYAVPLVLGCIGTRGGPVVDRDARVLDPHGNPIEGLYACGNVASCVFGPGYPGAGATLAAGMTFGYRAGRSLASTAMRPTPSKR